MSEMTNEEFTEAQKQIRTLLHDMSDEQKQSVLSMVKSQSAWDHTQQVAIISPYTMQAAVEKRLGKKPGEELTELIQGSSMWRNLEKDMVRFAEDRISAMVAPLKR